MEQRSTLLRGKKTPSRLLPRRHVIENILNYSKSMSIIRFPLGDSIMMINN